MYKVEGKKVKNRISYNAYRISYIVYHVMNTTTAGSDTGNYRTRDFDVVQCYSDQIKRPNMAIPMAKRHIHCHAELSRK